MVVEQKLFGEYRLDPLKVTGYEGMWGCIIWSILLPIFQFIPLDKSKTFPRGVIEDTAFAFR